VPSERLRRRARQRYPGQARYGPEEALLGGFRLEHEQHQGELSAVVAARVAAPEVAAVGPEAFGQALRRRRSSLVLQQAPAAIDRTREQIDLMEEYRTRRIADVVTG
jgi:hypothetical protein